MDAAERWVRAAHAQESGEVLVVLFTFEHDELAEPIRLSTDPTEMLSQSPLVYGTHSRGDDYLYVPVQPVLPSQEQDAPPQGSIRMARVRGPGQGEDPVDIIRSIHEPARVTLEVVLASDPDSVLESWPGFRWSSAQYDASWLTGQLTIDGQVDAVYPNLRFTPSTAPGLFR